MEQSGLYIYIIVFFICCLCKGIATAAPNEMSRDESKKKSHTLKRFAWLHFTDLIFQSVLATARYECLHTLLEIYSRLVKSIPNLYKLVLLLLLLLLHFSRRLPFVKSAMKRLSNAYHIVKYLASSLSLFALSLFPLLVVFSFYLRTSFVLDWFDSMDGVLVFISSKIHIIIYTYYNT